MNMYMKSPLVSIILPAYNVEKYISICLESLINQTYKNLEIIVVVDGSPDNTLLVAKQFAIKDERVLVIEQANSGSGPARNNGVNHSHGEFITFVDPDDWVNPDFIETLVELQSNGNYDLVVTGNEEHLFENNDQKSVTIHGFSEEKILNSISEVRNHYNHIRFIDQQINAPWAKLFKTSIIKEHNVRFPDLRRSQDIYFNGEYYRQISSLIESTYNGYCYRVIHGEFAKVHKDYYKISEILFNQYIDILNSWNIMPDMSYIYKTSLLNIISNYESLISQNESIKEISKCEYVKDVLLNGKSNNPYHLLMQFFLKNHFFQLAKIAIAIKYKLK